MSVKVAEEWLNSCSGCEISLLNIGEALLDLLPELDFVHMPVLMDHKYYGQSGEKTRLDIPEAVVGIVSGGIRNEEHLEVAEEMRKKCNVIIALGTCATHGGIPSLINQFHNEDLFERYYRTTETTEPGDTPGLEIPPMLDRCYALDEKIKVDVYLPGCPPHPDYITEAISALLQGRQPDLPMKSVCDTCPTRREGKGSVNTISRFTENAHFNPDEPPSSMRCLLEQGLMCMGPVTRAGCAGAHGDSPRCISARVPCRGCFGPVKQDGNQLIDMLNALASNGIDFSRMVDRFSLLRFSGAHRRLIPRRLNSQGAQKV
jgi:F420-non-reducing hydrogenase small subunit